MPRNVRNWWVEIDVEGRPTPVAAGPRGAGDGFGMTIYQREKGAVIEAVEVLGRVQGNELILTLRDAADGRELAIYRTQR